jgi:hypothetical protein
MNPMYTSKDYEQKLRKMTTEELITEITYEFGIEVTEEELEDERESYISELVFAYNQI